MREVLRDCFASKDFYILLVLPTECSFQGSQNNQKFHSPLNLGVFIPLFRRSFLCWKCYHQSVRESWFLLLCSDFPELKENGILKSVLILRTGKCKCKKSNPNVLPLI